MSTKPNVPVAAKAPEPVKVPETTKTKTELVCTIACQIRKGNSIIPFERGQTLTVTEDCIYPKNCFK